MGTNSINVETMDSKLAKGTNIVHGDFNKRVTEEETQELHSQIMTRRQLAFMIYSFKLRNVQSAVREAFKCCWEATPSARTTDPEAVLESLTYKQLESSQIKGLLALYIRDLVQRGTQYAKLFKLDEHGYQKRIRKKPERST